MFRVSVVQTNPIFLNRERNLTDIESRLKSISGDLIVLPELCTSGYNFSTKKQATACGEPAFSGPTSILLKRVAREKNCAIVAGFPEKAGNKLYNSSLYASPNEMKVYRKLHVFWNEKKFFSPGNIPLSVHRWKNASIGVMICFDWIFPEVARTLALKGAQILAHPSNLVLPYAPRGMRVRALENLVFTATANRVGKEGNLRYIGTSQITGVRGEVLKRLPKTKTGAGTVSIDPKIALNKNITPLNNLRKDRRPGFYR